MDSAVAVDATPAAAATVAVHPEERVEQGEEVALAPQQEEMETRPSSGSVKGARELEARDLEAQTMEDEEVAVPTKGPLMHKIIFLIMGTAELFVWNAVLSILYDIREQIYTDYPSMTDTLNAVNNVTNLGVAVYCVYTGAMNQKLIIISGFTLGISCLALAMVTQWSPGLTGVILYHLIQLVAGAACGMYQTGGFGLAAALPVPMIGWVSTGQGVSGVVCWILWTVISQGAKMAVKPAMWVMMSIGFAFCCFSTGCYMHLVRRADVAVRVERIQKALREEATNPDAPSYFFLFKQCWRHIFTIWYNLFITLFFFPNIGPLGWNAGNQTNYVLGCFQFGDLIGRYAPNLLKFIVFEPMTVMILVLCRTVLLPLAMVSYFKSDSAFWGASSWHWCLMITLAISNGWMATNVYLNTPKVIKAEEWRSRVTSMVIVGLLLGIACGLWSARIFTAIH